MKSIDFPEANLAIAKDQPEYLTLYAHMVREPQVPMYIVFELTDEEVEDIVKNKKLFYMQSTFGRPFSPMSIMTKNPFTNPIVPPGPPMDENRTTAEVWDKCHYSGTEGTIYPGQGWVVHGPCKNCGKEPDQHYWSTRQCEL